MYSINSIPIPNFIIQGCVDGTHIVIWPPEQNKDDYVNRKGKLLLSQIVM